MNRLIILLLFPCFTCFGQLEIKKGMSKEALIDFFSGAGIEIKGIKYKGVQKAIGKFSNADSIFDMHDGLVLSTGNVLDIPGENLSGSRSTKNRSKGHDLLTELCGAETMDAAVIEIQFVPKSKYISFNYVFGSEEYPEYVKSSFNDVFAFYLTTPKKKKHNIAVIPDSRSRIAINSVNQYRQSQYFVNNYRLPFPLDAERSDTVKHVENGLLYYAVTSYKIASAVNQNPKIPVEFDGYTRLIQAKSEVVPGKLHTLELCIADATDRIYDSGVLLETGSFQSHEEPDFRYGKLSSTDYYYEHDTVQAPIEFQLIYEAGLSRKEHDLLFGGPRVELVSETIIDDSSKSEVSLNNNLEVTESKKYENLHYIAHYPTDIHRVQDHDKNELRKLADHIDPKFKYEIQVISYTDQDASVGYNQKLSERRAAGIVAFLYNDYPSNVMIKKFSGKGIHQDLSLSKAEKRSTHITIKMVPSIDN